MFCPKCDNKTHVVECLVSEKKSEMYRRRKCSTCGYQFYTSEHVVDYNECFHKHWRDTQRDTVNRYRRQQGKQEVVPRVVPIYDITIDMNDTIYGRAFLEKFMTLDANAAKVNFDPRRYISGSSVRSSIDRNIKRYGLPLKVAYVDGAVYLMRHNN